MSNNVQVWLMLLSIAVPVVMTVLIAPIAYLYKQTQLLWDANANQKKELSDHRIAAAESYLRADHIQALVESMVDPVREDLGKIEETLETQGRQVRDYHEAQIKHQARMEALLERLGPEQNKL